MYNGKLVGKIWKIERVNDDNIRVTYDIYEDGSYYGKLKRYYFYSTFLISHLSISEDGNYLIYTNFISTESLQNIARKVSEY